MTNIEKWVPVSNAPEYQVSDLGRVRRGDRVLRPWLNQTGYRFIDIRQRKMRLHRLVYQEFCGPVSDGVVIDHVNGDKQDNRLANLEAVTQKENMRRAATLGLCVGGKAGPRRRVSPDEKEAIISARRSGMTNAQVCAQFGRPRSLVQRIFNTASK